MPNYFKMVGFYNLHPKEQILHLVFFETVVAELRKDMTARIIADRLNDQKQIIGANEVQGILEIDQYHFQESAVNDQRDRRQGEKAYHLTDIAKQKLIRAVNVRFVKLRFWFTPKFMIPFLLAMAFISVSIGLLSYHFAIIRYVSDLSWPAYRARTQMDCAPPEEKAKFVLYFITEHIKYRHDMTPQVISERLLDIGAGKVMPKVIEAHFKNNPAIFEPSLRSGAYHLTTAGVDDVKEKLGLNPSKKEGVFALKWFLEYEVYRATLMIPSLIGEALFIWAAALAYSKLV
ncbi:hypothetical protein HGB07_09490, partial [Candidatus Roizmanbacteria bacterium]|nr:hypothetical protein [Candidatus Roizmanbacteria bacterium]